MRIVVRSANPRIARETQAQLEAAGLHAQAIAGAPRPAPDGEDIAIFPMADGASAHAQALLNTQMPPLAVLSALTQNAPPPLDLSGQGPFQGAITADATPSLLAAQVEAHLRVAIAADELTRRRATATLLGRTMPSRAQARPFRVLYIGAPNALFLTLERVLDAHNGSVAAAFSSFAGFDHLHDEAFDAVVLNGAQQPQTALSLCSALRRNTTLFHLPTLLITAPGDAATAAAAIERGASSTVEEQANPDAGLGWLFEAIRRERRRIACEAELRALRDLMGDARTGLFHEPAFDVHLERLASDHHASGRQLAVAVLRVMPAHGARAPAEEVWRKGFTEVSSLAARLMRETDSGAALGRDLLAVALPCSDAAAAKRTAERIASVAECTAFAAGDNGAPLVFEQAYAELQPGESGAGMLARALRMIDAERLSA